MRNRMVFRKKLLVLLASGAVPFAFFGGTVCTQSNNYVTLLQSIGGAAINTASTQIVANNDISADVNTILVTPINEFLQSLWGNFVFVQFPQDFPRQVSPVQ